MTMIRLACNLVIHLAQAVLDTLDGRRPMLDDPLTGLDRVYTGPFDPIIGLNLWGADPQPDGKAPYCPRNDVPSDEPLSNDHPVTLGVIWP